VGAGITFTAARRKPHAAAVREPLAAAGRADGRDVVGRTRQTGDNGAYVVLAISWRDVTAWKLFQLAGRITSARGRAGGAGTCAAVDRRIAFRCGDSAGRDSQPCSPACSPSSFCSRTRRYGCLPHALARASSLIARLRALFYTPPPPYTHIRAPLRRNAALHEISTSIAFAGAREADVFSSSTLAMQPLGQGGRTGGGARR